MISDILGKKEEIVAKIKEKTGKTEGEIKKLIEEKKAEYGGLITEAGAAYAIARGLGIEFEPRAPERKFTKIKDVQADQQDVNIIARVMHIFSPRDFEKDGRKGRVVNLTIADETASARLVLWHSDVDLVTENRIRRGDVIEVGGGYARKTDGDLQINVGMSSTIMPSEDTGYLPKPVETVIKIAELTPDLQEFEIFGRLVQLSPEKAFRREDKSGLMRSFILGDDTGTVRAIAWNDSCSSLRDVREGDILKLEGAYSKQGTEAVEVHIGWKGRIIRNPDVELNIPKLDSFKKFRLERKFISDVKAEEEIEVRGTVMAVYKSIITTCPNCFHKVDGKCKDCGAEGKELLITNFDLDDGSDVIRGVLFGPRGEPIAKESVGKELIVRGHVRNNEQVQRLELLVRDVLADVDPVQEASLLI